MFERLIAYQAGMQPEAEAIATLDGRYSYGQMHGDILRVANVLAATTPIAAGQRVGVHVAHPYLYWLVTLALEELGAISVGLASRRADFIQFLGCDFVILEAAYGDTVEAPHLAINQAWIERMRASTPTPRRRRPRSPDDPIHIVATSGTTGQMRKILLTRRIVDQRLAQGLGVQASVSARPRAVCALPITSVGGFFVGLCAFMLGAALCHHDWNLPWTRTLDELAVDTVMLAPFHMQLLLATLPADATRRPGLTLFIGGGSLTRPLAAEARRRLTQNIYVIYGATESAGGRGHIDLMDGAWDAAGFIFPWVDAEVLDEAGRVLPAGQTGELRLRSEGMAEGYLDDQEATAQSFKDGWFYPRDMAVIGENGLLTVLGRADDLMHLGGAKFLPSQIEGWALSVPGVADAAAFSVPDHHGLETPWLAFVAEEGFAEPALQARLDEELGRPVRLMPLAAIPRNPMGKIERVTLRQQAAES